MDSQIKIIDLFAGPGGLGEGFSGYTNFSGHNPFKIALSIEKEASARKTLKLRAFYRQFPSGQAPDEYYRFLAGYLGKDPEEQLYRFPHLQRQAQAADEEARQLTLGENNEEIEHLIGKALGKNPGNWVLIGGPPCQAYSLVGRARNAGIANYKAENDHRNFLYKEYLNIIARFAPAVFVMENVKGILSAKVGGLQIFDKIREDLHCPALALQTGDEKNTYQIFSLVVASGTDCSEPDSSDFIIRAEQYGIPQARHRVILLGVRTDIANRVTPDTLAATPAPTVKEIISDLPRLRSGLSKGPDSMKSWAEAIKHHSATAIEAVSKSGMDDIARTMKQAVSTIDSQSLGRGSNWATTETSGVVSDRCRDLADWYRDPRGWKGICNHETRGHIPGDLTRYLFCSAFGTTGHENNWTPKAANFPSALAPDHKNWSSGKFADRFRVQVAERYATTITSHISKDGHYFIHYDPAQCRSLTVREAARIQTFPDNYFFVGNRTQQYTQVGNAVPPFLATKIAAIVSNIFSH
ncbi:DNA cytosine methyltransferase [Mariprofundus erugo]|uniref:DNA (cytosine-5-)-methyltransferase n=1 Tax=Mariprofundus erugo TaxID=2528639 RepID=A0A5R9GTZ4_9PROT|nr:DNA cytosine methyltransferase [Mariprofundus erugo]TLS68329.1 DNA cytosine methyltransferase [Mariprofundus erugo]